MRLKNIRLVLKMIVTVCRKIRDLLVEISFSLIFQFFSRFIISALILSVNHSAFEKVHSKKLLSAQQINESNQRPKELLTFE